jgi:hypothetical protein
MRSNDRSSGSVELRGVVQMVSALRWYIYALIVSLVACLGACAGPNLPMGANLRVVASTSDERIFESVSAAAISCGFIQSGGTLASKGGVEQILQSFSYKSLSGQPQIDIYRNLADSSVVVLESEPSRSINDGFSAGASQVLQCFEGRLRRRMPGVFGGGILGE